MRIPSIGRTTTTRLGVLGLLLLSLGARAITITSNPSSQNINPGDPVTLGVAVDSSDCVTTSPGSRTWVQPPSYQEPQPDLVVQVCDQDSFVPVPQPDYLPPCYYIWVEDPPEWVSDPMSYETCQEVASGQNCDDEGNCTTTYTMECTITYYDNGHWESRGHSEEICPPPVPQDPIWVLVPGECHWITIPVPPITITPPGYYEDTPSSTSPTPLHYQWFVGAPSDTSMPAGLTDSSVISVSPTETTQYWVRVTCDFGSTADSAGAVVTVVPPAPPIVTPPTGNLPVLIHQNVILTESASGYAPLHYQWYIGNTGDVNQPVGTDSTTYTAADLTNNLSVWVRVTDFLGRTADSPALTVPVVLPAPPVVSTPIAVTPLPIAFGQSATLSAQVVGSAPFTYAWYQGPAGDTAHAVGSSSSLLISPALTNATSFWVRVTDVHGQTADSSALSVTVVPVGLSLGTVSGCVGSDVSVPFLASGFNGIGSLQTSITWDPSVVTYMGFATNALPGLGPDNVLGDPAHGLVSLVWEDATLAGSTVPDGSVLFSMIFHISGAPGSSTPVVITNRPTPLEVTDADGNVLVASLTPGQISANGNVQVSGNIHYYQSAAPVGQVIVVTGNGYSGSTTTGTNGNYSISVPSCIDLTITPGFSTDLPITKGVTSLDVAAVRYHIQGQSHLSSPYALLAADVNESQSITASDLRQIRLFMLNLRTNFAAQGGLLWRFIPASYVFPDPANPWSAPGFSSLTGLTMNSTAQDFIAVKLGDVDGSWASTPQGTARGIHLLGGPVAPIHLSANQALADSGKTVRVTVQSTKVDRLTTAQFTLKWNPEVLKLTSPVHSDLAGFSSENLGQSRVALGQLDFGWDDPNLAGVSVSEGQALLTLDFDVVGPGGSSSQVSISDSPTPIELSVRRNVVATTETPGLIAVRASNPGTLGVIANSKSHLDLWYEAPPGSVWMIQSSSDLKRWSPVGGPAPAPSDGLATVSLPASGLQKLYYRAVRTR